MSSVKCDSAVMFGFLISLVLVFQGVVVITSAQNCSESLQGRDFCGDIVEINYPFWYDNYEYSKGSGYYCGYPGFGIKCADEGRTTVMNISNQLYLPSNIHYRTKYLIVKEIDIDQQECPHPKRSFSSHQFQLSVRSWTFYYNCSAPPNYFEKFHVRCLDKSGLRSFAFPNETSVPKWFNVTGNCEKHLLTPYSINEHYNYTTDAKQGFLLRWSTPRRDCEKCERSGRLCIYNSTGVFQNCSGLSMGLAPGVSPSHQPTFKSYQHRQRGLSTRVKLVIVIGLFASIGVLLVVLLLTCRWIHFSLYCLLNCHWRNNIKSSTNVDTFLESCGSLALQRYRYSDIKQMTNSFKEILGEGGYGCVFKGKLKGDGRLVAVKMLNESKGNGEDFINEVATIGRTNHVNVVSLLGFCTEGTKRALVYEFMPNGSLERFIYNEKTSSAPLGLEKLYQIALGIARGLDYLHRGCNTRILHFDIKPHNILLDQEFCPKISDFGLAKLCPTRESVVSMLVARGTIGYIAPEVYCRNFGGVSHKSDVYSYGMMVLEMIGGRKNIDPTVENVSEIYFPQWIYNQLNQNIDVEGSGEIFQDATTKKMIIVALWCVQTQPTDRPSINKVVEMLEGSTEELQLPPNPFQVPPSRSSPP